MTLCPSIHQFETFTLRYVLKISIICKYTFFFLHVYYVHLVYIDIFACRLKCMYAFIFSCWKKILLRGWMLKMYWHIHGLLKIAVLQKNTSKYMIFAYFPIDNFSYRIITSLTVWLINNGKTWRQNMHFNFLLFFIHFWLIFKKPFFKVSDTCADMKQNMPWNN